MHSGVVGSMVLSEEPATDLGRIRSEFRSLPGMCLTVAQVARLLDAPTSEALLVLLALEAEGLLVRSPNGTYRLASPLLA